MGVIVYKSVLLDCISGFEFGVAFKIQFDF